MSVVGHRTALERLRRDDFRRVDVVVTGSESTGPAAEHVTIWMSDGDHLHLLKRRWTRSRPRSYATCKISHSTNPVLSKLKAGGVAGQADSSYIWGPPWSLRCPARAQRSPATAVRKRTNHGNPQQHE